MALNRADRFEMPVRAIGIAAERRALAPRRRDEGVAIGLGDRLDPGRALAIERSARRIAQIVQDRDIIRVGRIEVRRALREA